MYWEARGPALASLPLSSVLGPVDQTRRGQDVRVPLILLLVSCMHTLGMDGSPPVPVLLVGVTGKSAPCAGTGGVR